MKKILIVDDDKIIGRALKEELSLSGFKVATSLGGREALKRCRREKFDLIYLNLVMYPMDGIQTCKTIREANPEAKIILASGNEEELVNREKEIKRAGADVILRKPFLESIVKITRKILKTK